MAINLDPLLIQPEDFKEFRDISANLDPERLNAFVRESQVNELRNLLSDELYLALISDYDDQTDTFTEERFTDLWFGVDYDFNGKQIRYYGLKPSIIYHAYARFIRNQQFNVTRYGVKHITSDNSEDETIQQIRTKINDAQAYANLYAEGFRKYLSVNGDLFPEYETTSENDTPKTGFNFTQVFPRSRYDFSLNKFYYF